MKKNVSNPAGLFLFSESNRHNTYCFNTLHSYISSLPSHISSEIVTNEEETTRDSFRGVDFPGAEGAPWGPSVIGFRESEAVLAYLCAAEISEPDIHFRDDIRIAWLTVSLAWREYADPWGYAFWTLYGKTFAKAQIAWAEERRQNDLALARAAAEVQARHDAQPLYESARDILSLPPKKPVKSARVERKKAA